MILKKTSFWYFYKIRFKIIANLFTIFFLHFFANFLWIFLRSFSRFFMDVSAKLSTRLIQNMIWLPIRFNIILSISLTYRFHFFKVNNLSAFARRENSQREFECCQCTTEFYIIRKRVHWKKKTRPLCLKLPACTCQGYPGIR